MLQIRPRRSKSSPHIFFALGVRGQRFVGVVQTGLQLRELRSRTLELTTDASRDCIAIATLFLGSLTPRRRVAQPLLGYGNLTAQLLRAFALVRDESRQLGAS